MGKKNIFKLAFSLELDKICTNRAKFFPDCDIFREKNQFFS